jgi:ATP-dependent DNA ligase
VVDLPVMPPVPPMLAKAVTELPTDGEFVYEPKWDGFRSIIFRDGPEVEVASRNERPFTRYFPDLVPAAVANLPPRSVVDGEIVVPGPRGLDFDALSQRIHPAESRVRMLAEKTPARFVAFDLLAVDDTDLRPLPLRDRVRALGELLGPARPPVHLTPSTTDPAVASDWFDRFEGAGLDGVVAKPADSPYLEGQRGWWKVKPVRSADCVVAGFRWHKDGKGVGSLLLGLYDHLGELHHVGVAASFAAKLRSEFVEVLQPYREGALEGHPWRRWAEAEAHAEGGRMPGGLSRWSQGKDLSWEPVRPELVCEVRYEQLQGNRFRHVARFLRWRPDRDPASCRYDQLIVAPPTELDEVFGMDQKR